MRSSLATLSTVAVLLAASAVPAFAQQAEPLTLRQIRLAMTPVKPAPVIRFETSQVRRSPASTVLLGLQRPSKAKRALWASLAGVGGFFGGGFLGAKLEPDCNCDDPGLQGFLIGAPVGAITGAILGWKFGR